MIPDTAVGTLLAFEFDVRAFRPAFLFSVAALAAGAYGGLSRVVAERRTVGRDKKIRRGLQQLRWPPADLAAHATNPLGKEWFHIPAAVLLSAYVSRRGRRHGALVPALAAAVAEVLSRTVDRIGPHRRPPPGHPERYKESFPSGHALETTAVTATGAYVLARENLASTQDAFAAAAALSVASTFGRMYLDRHWASDVVAGAALGVSIAAVCAAIYEMSAPLADPGV